MIKKKIIAGLLGTGVVLVGTNVYATTALDTNLLAWIKSGVQSLGNFYTSEAKKEITDLNNKFQADISTYVDKKTDEIILDIENTKNAEVDRAKKELDSHYQQVTEATSQAIEQETNEVKVKIKADVDTEVAKAKNEMDKKLEEKLKEMQKELQSQGN